MTGEQPSLNKFLHARPEQGITDVIADATERIVEGSRRRAPAVVGLCLALTALFAWYAATHLGINTNTDRLIDPTLPWRQANIEMRRLFPQNEGVLVIVVDGATPEVAEDAAARLTTQMAGRPDLFTSVRRPDASEFFR